MLLKDILKRLGNLGTAILGIKDELGKIKERLVVLETRAEMTSDEMEKMLAEIITRIGRLERIAGLPLISDEELDRRLTELEGKAQRKPQ